VKPAISSSRASGTAAKQGYSEYDSGGLRRTAKLFLAAVLGEFVELIQQIDPTGKSPKVRQARPAKIF
jgi:hypothetical protein